MTYAESPREFEMTLGLKPISFGFHSRISPFQVWCPLRETSLPQSLSIPGRDLRVPGQSPISLVTINLGTGHRPAIVNHQGSWEK